MSVNAEVKHKHYSLIEEVMNSVTHGIGVGLSIAGLVWLILRAVRVGDTLGIVSVIIFGVSLLLLYLASTLYHAIPCFSVKRVFRVFDHCAIYLLIAGTYTPFLLVSMRGPWGWTFFGILWGIACIGCAFKAGGNQAGYHVHSYRGSHHDGYRRPGLYLWCVFLCVQSDSLQSRHLALLCHGGKRHPFLCGYPLCA